MGVKHFEDMKLLKSSELDEKPCSSPDIKDGFVDSVDGIDDKNNESDIEDICSKNETVLYERKNSTSEAICKETRLKVIEENMKINFKIEANVNFPPNSAHISMWDFAGEDVFYATHHVFLSPDAVYLIVIDLSNADTNNITEIGKCGFSTNQKLCKCIYFFPIAVYSLLSFLLKEKAKFWLRSILTYSKVKDEDERCGFRLPPVIFVVTHKDRIIGEVRVVLHGRSS